MSCFFSCCSWSTAACLLAFVGIFFSAVARNDDPAEIEKGAVRWSTDLESAKRQALRTGRPVFLLFQEIPG